VSVPPGDQVEEGRTMAAGTPVSFGRGMRVALLAASMLAVAACGTTTTKHGHHFGDNDVSQIQPGMNQDAVRMALGSPTTTSAVGNGNAYYYISSTTKQTAFFKPDEVDRRVLAVYFNRIGSVEHVANYGLKDGQVVNYANGETPAHIRDQGFIKKFFRGVGPKTTLGEKD
jgi:outer membrane protein assembly factor BamE (lipoprotein component of BamABCDE complex)